jgi:hypothetical protein
MTTEHITWRLASDLPDSDLTVLCWGAEGFFCGYWDDGLQQWVACESGGSVLGVTHWCEPEGPVADSEGGETDQAAPARRRGRRATESAAG